MPRPGGGFIVANLHIRGALLLVFGREDSIAVADEIIGEKAGSTRPSKGITLPCWVSISLLRSQPRNLSKHCRLGTAVFAVRNQRHPGVQLHRRPE
jgi:hypothetical protein